MVVRTAEKRVPPVDCTLGTERGQSWIVFWRTERGRVATCGMDMTPASHGRPTKLPFCKHLSVRPTWKGWQILLQTCAEVERDAAAQVKAADPVMTTISADGDGRMQEDRDEKRGNGDEGGQSTGGRTRRHSQVGGGRWGVVCAYAGSGLCVVQQRRVSQFNMSQGSMLIRCQGTHNPAWRSGDGTTFEVCIVICTSQSVIESVSLAMK